MIFDVKGGMWLPAFFSIETSFGSSGWWQNLTINTASGKVAFIFRAPKTGTVDKVGINIRGVTTSQSLDVRLETVNPANGDPTGTLVAAGAVGSIASPAANTFYEVTLGTPPSVTINDYIAVVIQFTSTTGNLQIGIWNVAVSSGDYAQLPYCNQYIASWTKQRYFPVCSLRYNDSSYPFNGMLPLKDQNEIALNLNSTPDEVGLKFRLPGATRLKGLWLFTYLRYPLTLKLYDNIDTLIDSVVMDPDVKAGTGAGWNIWLFNSSIQLQANKDYRITVLPTTADDIFVQYLDVLNNAMLEQFTADGNFIWTQRTNAGAWTDTNTRRPYWGIIIDAIECINGCKVYFNREFN